MRIIILSVMVFVMGVAAGCGDKQMDQAESSEGGSQKESESMTAEDAGKEGAKAMQKAKEDAAKAGDATETKSTDSAG